MPAAKYDFYVDRGATFKAFLEYQTLETTGIDLTGYEAHMQVRRSSSHPDMLLDFSGSVDSRGLTGGGSTGSFSEGEGVSGTGGIYLNSTSTGITGGKTGGIFIFADNVTMQNVPNGQHFYDMELTDPSGNVSRVIEGRFRVSPDITR